MSYKNTLQEHNILLQQAIDKANALPDAGSGAPAEDLTSEIEAQAALIEEQAGQIEELLTVLDGKAAGGSGKLETCTLKIQGVTADERLDTVVINQVYYPVMTERGTVGYSRAFDEPVQPNYIEFENVVVGYPVVVSYALSMEMPTIETLNAECLLHDYEMGETALFRCTQANDVSVITIIGEAQLA